MKTTIIYGSSTGNTQSAAGQLAKLMPGSQVFEVTDVDTSDFEDCDLLVLGTSTWGFGELQSDWESVLDNLRNANLENTKVALFGLGDQATYPSTFVDGMRPLHEAAKEAGAEMIGLWTTDDYDFQDSAALEGDKFIGLALDEENQPELSASRMKGWAEQLLNEMGHQMEK